ncbi:hypothetical protein PMAYCL1PPCAC_25413, partial [Pristionchus mayeri]
SDKGVEELVVKLPVTQFSMRSLGLLLLATVAAASWLGDEYWTLIGPRGQPIQGNAANFARVAQFFKPDEHNRFVAFWMTNTHYAGRMFEQFGEAFLNEDDDKYCARFTGERGEAVEVCENFRILTVPQRYRGRTIFEWVKIEAIDGLEIDKIGYNDHRICAFAYNATQTAEGVTYSEFTFGDAVPSKNVANAVNKLNQAIYSANFDNYFLKLIVGEDHAQSRHHPIEQHVAHRHHQQRQENVAHMQQQYDQHHQERLRLQQEQQQREEAHAKEQQAQRDAEYQRRLAEYNEQLRQQQEQQQQREQPDQQSNQVQAHVQQVQQQQNRFICDNYGRVFETKTGEDGRTRYVTYDLAAHGGVRPPCTLIGETPSGEAVRQEGGVVQPVQQHQQQRHHEQRPYPVRRSCSGSRKKKDAEGDC